MPAQPLHPLLGPATPTACASPAPRHASSGINPREALPVGNVTDYFEWLPGTNKVGEGSYANVYKARCVRPRAATPTTPGEWYAVKAIKKEHLRTDKQWQTVLQEIETLRCIKSTHCVRLFDAFQSEKGELYIVLEATEGGDLLGYISERIRLSEQEANQITRQLLEALRFLHCDQKVVHLDLKPDNILMVKGRLQIKLIDFGFAKFFGQQRSPPCPSTADPQLVWELAAALSPGATAPGTPADLVLTAPGGTLKYCAPEILKRRMKYDMQPCVTTCVDIQKLDVFAAGVIVYIMLCGHFPFTSESELGLFTQMNRGAKFPADRFQGVSADAQDFCRWLLHPDRRERPLSWEALSHRWLCSAVPATPLEVWQSGEVEKPKDDGLFAAMRAMDEEGEGTPKAIPLAVPPRPTSTVKISMPKKDGAKRPYSPPSSMVIESASPVSVPPSGADANGNVDTGTAE